MAPEIEKLSASHPNAVFLKVDADQCQVGKLSSQALNSFLHICQTESQQYEITAMPTFVFIRQSKELERIRGGDTGAIKAALAKYYKDTPAFGGTGHSMTDANTASKTNSSASESDHQRFEQVARERFGNAKEGQTMTALRLRLPGVATPVNIRLSTDRTLNDVRQLLCEAIPSFQTTPFEFMEPPATKIKDENEKKTLSDVKLLNAVLTVKRL